MGVKVAKFGGSSLADADQFRKMAEIIKADDNRRYMVPSAPGRRTADDRKITDLLYLCHAHTQQAVPFDDVFELVAERYRQIVEQLGLDFDIDGPLDEVRQRVADGASADYTASRGEYLNGLVIAELLGFDFIDPAEMIHFRANGAFDAEETQQAVSRHLREHERGVIPGFYGSTPDGKIKTFSRGGSDITGAIVARGVGADVYENWTDVSGLLMADPRVVDSPKPIDKLTYRELRELSYMGATVLHDEAIFPVRIAGIPVHIRNTNDPDAPGTLIVRDADPITQKGMITGIAGRKDFTIISIEKALMNQEVGFGRRVLGVLENNGISFEHIPSGIDTLSVVVHDDLLESKQDRLVGQLNAECEPDLIEVQPNMALIATVGRGMAYTPGIASRVFGALGNAGINIRMIDQGSSELNIIVGVEADDFEKAMQAIYREFVDA